MDHRNLEYLCSAMHLHGKHVGASSLDILISSYRPGSKNDKMLYIGCLPWDKKKNLLWNTYFLPPSWPKPFALILRTPLVFWFLMAVRRESCLSTAISAFKSSNGATAHTSFVTPALPTSCQSSSNTSGDHRSLSVPRQPWCHFP